MCAKVGFGREGGWEGLMAYLKPDAKTKARPRHPRHAGAPKRRKRPTWTAPPSCYIAGKQARPDGGYSRAVWSPKGKLLGHIGLGNRKDIRNAVEAAQAAKGWAKTTGHARAQILYYIAENLSARAAEFAARLKDMTGKPGAAEVEATHQPPVHLCRLGRQIRRRRQTRADARHRPGDERTPWRDRRALPG